MAMEDFDPETVRKMSAYCGGDPRVPEKVSEEVFSQWGEETWALPDFLASLNAAIATIPEACRAEALVELSGGYDESTTFKITYGRLQTDEEVCARVGRALAHVRATEAQERATFERLKAKFEGSENP